MGRFNEQWVSSKGDGDAMMSIMVSSFIWKYLRVPKCSNLVARQR